MYQEFFSENHQTEKLPNYMCGNGKLMRHFCYEWKEFKIWQIWFHHVSNLTLTFSIANLVRLYISILDTFLFIPCGFLCVSYIKSEYHGWIQYDVCFGWFIFPIHSWGGSDVVCFVYTFETNLVIVSYTYTYGYDTRQEYYLCRKCTKYFIYIQYIHYIAYLYVLDSTVWMTLHICIHIPWCVHILCYEVSCAWIVRISPPSSAYHHHHLRRYYNIRYGSRKKKCTWMCSLCHIVIYGHQLFIRKNTLCMHQLKHQTIIPRKNTTL